MPARLLSATAVINCFQVENQELDVQAGITRSVFCPSPLFLPPTQTHDPLPPTIPSLFSIYSLFYNKHGREIRRYSRFFAEWHSDDVPPWAGEALSPVASRRGGVFAPGLLLDPLRPLGLFLGRGFRPVAGCRLLSQAGLLVVRSDTRFYHHSICGGAGAQLPMVRVRLRRRQRERHGCGCHGSGVQCGEPLQHQGQRSAGRWPLRCGHRNPEQRWELLQSLCVALPKRRARSSAGTGLEVRECLELSRMRYKSIVHSFKVSPQKFIHIVLSTCAFPWRATNPHPRLGVFRAIRLNY